MSSADIDWIVDKASEILDDKVRDGPLKDKDIELAYGMIAKRRLEKMSDSFSNDKEYEKAASEIKEKLHKIAEELNKKHWENE